MIVPFAFGAARIVPTALNELVLNSVPKSGSILRTFRVGMWRGEGVLCVWPCRGLGPLFEARSREIAALRPTYAVSPPFLGRRMYVGWF